jgi:DeoR-like helix-turn-helix domain
MTANGRKYGERQSYAIPVWNGILEARHRRRIGGALWEFLWCLDRITKEKEGVGIVLGGKPVISEEVAKGFGVCEQTVRRHFDRLEKQGYIERILTPYGYSIRVRNSLKFSSREVVQNCPTSAGRGSAKQPDLTVQNCTTSPCKTARPNKDLAVDLTVENTGRPKPQNHSSNRNPTPKPAVQRDRFGTVLAHQGEL